MQSLLTNLTDDDRQGELQGVIASLGALAAIITPLTMQPLFHHFTQPDAPIYLPSAPFVASAILTVVALGLFFRELRHKDLGPAE
jgi:DHA1 family tetracycline resistance protein-like MFS transporter